MKKLLTAFLFSAFALPGAFAQPRVDADSLRKVMEKEATAFLQAMPEGLQTRQAEAVAEALDGRYEKLQSVRASRNTTPELPRGIVATDLTAHARMFRPAAAQSEPLSALLYLHGGGWCFGSINSCTAFCTTLAQKARIAVIALDYPLAPEHPYPDTLHVCTSFLDSVFKLADDWHIDPGRISIGGDSAGGNLALAVALSWVAKESSGHLRSLLLFYPVTHVGRDNSGSWEKFGDGYGLDSTLMDVFNKAYAQNTDTAAASLSPVLASEEQLSGLPSVLMVSAERDILLGQGIRMKERLESAGCDVRHVILPGTVHLFITVPGQPTAFSTAVDLSAEFLGK